MTETTYSQPKADEIPDSMTAREQWLCWREEERDGKPTKVPINAADGKWASTTDPGTWSTFDTAYEFATEWDYGLGFVFTEIDPLVGIDLDDCRDPESGRPSPVAKAIIGALDSYTEVSPSGEGYHVILQGRLPSSRNRRGTVEMYEMKRFFTVTGHHVEGTPMSAKERYEELDEVYHEHIGAEPTVDEGEGDANRSDTPALSDSELIRRARAAKNGQKFDRLWRGSTAGYDSHSEADMALCCLLAFWTGGDTSRIDALFRNSGLMRKKWDERHYADGSTYGQVTVERAVEVTTEFYEPGGTGHGTPLTAEAAGAREAARPQRAHGAESYTAERARLLARRVEALEQELRIERERVVALEERLDAHAGSLEGGETQEVERVAEERGGLFGRFRSLWRR